MRSNKLAIKIDTVLGQKNKFKQASKFQKVKRLSNWRRPKSAIVVKSERENSLKVSWFKVQQANNYHLLC
jgi:hypothetical protein